MNFYYKVCFILPQDYWCNKKDIISVYLPDVEATQSIAFSTVEPFAVNPENGIVIEKATENKNNSLSILIENASSEDSKVTFVAGDTYPNAMLGNLEVPLKSSTTTVCQLQDISRFENRDGSIALEFPEEFSGNVLAVAKRAGIIPIA